MIKEYELKIKNTKLTGMDRFMAEKEYIHKNRNAIGRCEYCNGSIKDRKIAMWKGLIDALYNIYCWCGKNKKHEFKMKDIRHFLGKPEYSCFNNFVRFGGIIYRPKIEGKKQPGLYGMNMVRAKEFFSGQRDIPLQITLDQITGEIIEEVRGKVWDFPELSAFIKKDGLYDYEMPVQNALLP